MASIPRHNFPSSPYRGDVIDELVEIVDRHNLQPPQDQTAAPAPAESDHADD